MPNHQINTSEAAAKAKFALPATSAAEIIQTTGQVAKVVKAHPDFAAKPDIQKGVDVWVGAAEGVGKVAEEIKAVRLSLTALIAKREKQLAAYKRATAALVATVDQECGGSAEAIKKWGLGVVERLPSADSTDAPTGLRAKIRKDFSLQILWDAVPGHFGYFLQMGDGTPEGWGPSMPVPRARFLPTGLSVGQKVAFRVAVQRKNGLSAFSDALTVTAK